MTDKRMPRLRDIQFRPYFDRGVEFAQCQAGMGIHFQFGSTIFGIVDMNYRDRNADGSRKRNPHIRLLFPSKQHSI